MDEKLILEDEFTDKILEAISVIKNRAKNYLGMNLDNEDIIVVSVGGFIFVLGNPIIPRIVDNEEGLVTEEVKNITIECDDRKLIRNGTSMTFSFVPHLLISCPFLLARIQDDKITYGG